MIVSVSLAVYKFWFQSCNNLKIQCTMVLNQIYMSTKKCKQEKNGHFLLMRMNTVKLCF